ncbi:hypothetical protein OQA88_12425 [Cercophora sp. LCS_1]
MLPNVDPAILTALSLSPTSSKLTPHGSSSFTSTYKLTTTTSGLTQTYFVKTAPGPQAETMFQGEHHSLNAIASAVPNFCPRSHAHGALTSTPGKYFLVTDFLDLGFDGSSGSGLSLAQKLAKMHTTVVGDRFGFPVATCCGATEQENGWRERWDDFYANCRLRSVVRGKDRELVEMVERVAGTVVPRLLGGMDIKPVVVHGDLWSGNAGRGRIGGAGGVEEVVFDPACVYGHSEYELGIMKMFGGFGRGFWTEYERLKPRDEPSEEWEDRVELYELYHHLNHFRLFGGGYRGGAMAIMKRLIGKYGHQQ